MMFSRSLAKAWTGRGSTQRSSTFLGLDVESPYPERTPGASKPAAALLPAQEHL